MKHGKRYRNAIEEVSRGPYKDLGELIPQLKKTAKAKFDETVELSMRLNVDPRRADQMVRGTVVPWAPAGSCPTPRRAPSPSTWARRCRS